MVLVNRQTPESMSSPSLSVNLKVEKKVDNEKEKEQEEEGGRAKGGKSKEGKFALPLLDSGEVEKKKSFGYSRNQEIDTNSQVDYLIKHYRDLMKYLESRGLFEMGEVVKETLSKMKAREKTSKFAFIVLSGYGGSGKTKLARYLLDYLQSRVNKDYCFISTDDSTTTENLLCRATLVDGSEAKKEGRMGSALKGGHNVLLDELNRTEFRNIQKLMSLFGGDFCDSEGEIYQIKPNTIVVATINLASVGTYPLPEEFKQRFSLVRVDYTNGQIKKIFRRLYNDENKEDMVACLHLYSIDKSRDMRNGWKSPFSIRTLVNLLVEMDIGLNLLPTSSRESYIRGVIDGAVKSFINETNPYDLKESEKISKDIYGFVKQKLADGNISPFNNVVEKEADKGEDKKDGDGEDEEDE